MIQEEIIEMAREAGGEFYVTSGNQTPTWYFSHSTIYDFVKLVAAKALAQSEQTNTERHEANVQKFLAAPQPKQELVVLPLVQFEKVAEGIEVGYDVFGGVDIRLGGEFVYVHINYDYRYTHNAERKALAKQIVGLLTTPPQRKPLTDEQIKTVIQSIDPDEQYMPPALRQFARAIEAAHGIKENT